MGNSIEKEDPERDAVWGQGMVSRNWKNERCPIGCND